jgi:hypothetical protein
MTERPEEIALPVKPSSRRSGRRGRRRLGRSNAVQLAGSQVAVDPAYDRPDNIAVVWPRPAPTITASSSPNVDNALDNSQSQP